jgi:hypothetical protein
MSSYFIETSLGRITFSSEDVGNIHINSRKVNEYKNFKPTNNVKFLKFADKYSIKNIGGAKYNIYSKKTKNGIFLKLETDGLTVEYKIFDY